MTWSLCGQSSFSSSEMGRKWEVRGGDPGKFIDQMARRLSDSDYTLGFAGVPRVDYKDE